MKAEGVEDWLKHWLKMQQRKRRPLTLKYITEDHLPNRKPTTKRPKAGGNEKAKAKSAPQSSKDKNDSDSASSSDAESSAESSEEGGEEGGEESDGESGEERDEEDATKIKGKGKKAANKGSSNGKDKHTNDCSDEEEDDGANKSNLVNTSASPTGVAQDDPTLPPSPSSAAQSKETCHAFLKSLSDDKNYRQLVRLLYAAKVSDFRPYYLPPSVR